MYFINLGKGMKNTVVIPDHEHNDHVLDFKYPGIFCCFTAYSSFLQGRACYLNWIIQSVTILQSDY